MLCGLIKILLHASAKKKTERLKGFKFRTFNGRFSSDIIAVKGLRALLPLAYIFLHPPPFISTPHPPAPTPQLPTQSNQQRHRRWKLPQHPYRQLRAVSHITTQFLNGVPLTNAFFCPAGRAQISADYHRARDARGL